ncbi:hypothetical protein K2173_026348 [Erythroxylum novogranatense]|uniref:Non-specific lipid-transfer protein n=1 Tax=Erythroxylum novogranatense TaxID=1862640 RepID=A0AAV8SN33_9ROSI|nr:hypothetical protein K2173_026348 [Erythroxylum novogranatense]
MKRVLVSMLVVVVMVQLGKARTSGNLRGGNPPTACCDGVKNIKAITPTTVDRRAAYNCVKAAAARYPNIKLDAASSLPKKCGVEMNNPISQATNCDKYTYCYHNNRRISNKTTNDYLEAISYV